MSLRSTASGVLLGIATGACREDGPDGLAYEDAVGRECHADEAFDGVLPGVADCDEAPDPMFGCMGGKSKRWLVVEREDDGAILNCPGCYSKSDDVVSTSYTDVDCTTVACAHHEDCVVADALCSNGLCFR